MALLRSLAPRLRLSRHETNLDPAWPAAAQRHHPRPMHRCPNRVMRRRAPWPSGRPLSRSMPCTPVRCCGWSIPPNPWPWPRACSHGRWKVWLEYERAHGLVCDKQSRSPRLRIRRTPSHTLENPYGRMPHEPDNAFVGNVDSQPVFRHPSTRSIQ